jgi:hypothetical protein
MTMNAVLTLDEIEARFPSEWVLIGDPQTDELQHLLSGTVLFHSPDRDEVDRKLLELRPPRFAFRYLGLPPEDIVLIP